MGQQSSQSAHPNPTNPAPHIAVPTTLTGAVANPGVTGVGSWRHNSLFFCGLFGVGLFTFNSIVSIRRSIHDPWTVAYVAVSYVDILLLYCCFHLVERTAPGEDRRLNRLKKAVWSLASILILMFACRVSTLTIPALAVLVWVMSAITMAGGFYAMFLYKETPEKEDPAAWKNFDAYQKC
ncbi:hypothetical protein KSP40_PGU010973 [Platanthera guangdongensis]|uniref:Uncharacterized protein n=1 Tax=Platanthera guangdongensis TaxID=2320717 RepID=A0ABR2LGK7_9ASPA